jgi:hypothetical protein
MSSLCNFMDCPEWTPEQRIAVTLVETLCIKRNEEEQARAARFHARNAFTAGHGTGLLPADLPLDRAMASTLSKEPA